jgi:response regulator RpfG family c-di-GMP phosphodiesterase
MSLVQLAKQFSFSKNGKALVLSQLVQVDYVLLQVRQLLMHGKHLLDAMSAMKPSGHTSRHLLL